MRLAGSILVILGLFLMVIGLCGGWIPQVIVFGGVLVILGELARGRRAVR